MIQQQFAVPSTLNIPLILTSVGRSDQYIYDHQDKYHYVLHKIAEGRVFNKSMSARSFTNLNKKLLRTVLGIRYTDTVLSDLIDLGIVETDRHHIHGVKSRGYRIAHEHNTKCVLRDIFKSEVWNAKVQKMHRAYVAKLNHALATEWGNLSQIGINALAATAFIEAKYAQSMKMLDTFKEMLDTQMSGVLTKVNYSRLLVESKYWKGIYSLKVLQVVVDELSRKHNFGITLYQYLQDSITNQYNADLISIEKIDNEDFFLEQPDPTSRIYTNLTNLSSDLRQFLTHKTMSNMTNMDIMNSQPYVFCTLLREKYKGQELPEDVQKYITLTSTGKFYEYVMNLLDVPADERKAFKIQFFAKIFYCQTGYSVRTREGKLFRKEFKNVYALINEYKEESYQNLSIQMQRTEANIILNSIGDELKKRHIWYSTIHDSVVVLKEHQEEVKHLIIQQFLRVVGVAPSVKPEDLLGGLGL